MYLYSVGRVKEGRTGWPLRHPQDTAKRVGTKVAESQRAGGGRGRLGGQLASVWLGGRPALRAAEVEGRARSYVVNLRK